MTEKCHRRIHEDLPGIAYTLSNSSSWIISWCDATPHRQLISLQALPIRLSWTAMNLPVKDSRICWYLIMMTERMWKQSKNENIFWRKNWKPGTVHRQKKRTGIFFELDWQDKTETVHEQCHPLPEKNRENRIYAEIIQYHVSLERHSNPVLLWDQRTRPMAGHIFRRFFSYLYLSVCCF